MCAGPVIGRPSTPEEIRGLPVGTELSPEKSVERLDKYGKYLLGTVASVGTVLTGFGIFSPSASSAARNPWFLLPVGLACLSLAFAAVAVTPVIDQITPAYQDAIQRHYAKLIRRGRFVTWAGWLFALSLATAAIAVGAAAGVFDPMMPKVSFTWSKTNSAPTLAMNLKFERVPRFAVIETRILASPVEMRNGARILLFDDISRPDSQGNVEVSSKFNNLEPYYRFVLLTKATSGSAIIYKDQMEILSPALPTPTPRTKIAFPSIHFDFNHAEIRPSEAAILDNAVMVLKQHAELTIYVDGYCDAAGGELYNLRLSRERARAVAQFFDPIFRSPRYYTITATAARVGSAELSRHERYSGRPCAKSPRRVNARRIEIETKKPGLPKRAAGHRYN